MSTFHSILNTKLVAWKTTTWDGNEKNLEINAGCITQTHKETTERLHRRTETHLFVQNWMSINVGIIFG